MLRPVRPESAIVSTSVPPHLAHNQLTEMRRKQLHSDTIDISTRSSLQTIHRVNASVALYSRDWGPRRLPVRLLPDILLCCRYRQIHPGSGIHCSPFANSIRHTASIMAFFERVISDGMPSWVDSSVTTSSTIPPLVCDVSMILPSRIMSAFACDSLLSYRSIRLCRETRTLWREHRLGP